MNTAKIYHDSEGNECSIFQMVRREPDWAAARIQEGEKAIAKIKELDALIKEIATEFYYSWHNSTGTNPADGFDSWWELNKQRFYR